MKFAIFSVQSQIIGRNCFVVKQSLMSLMGNTYHQNVLLHRLHMASENAFKRLQHSNDGFLKGKA